MDITERKRAEEELLRREQRYRAMVTAIPDTVLRLDSNDKVADFHTQDETEYGGTSDRLLGGGLEDVWPADVAEILRNGAGRARERSEDIVAVEYEFEGDRVRNFEARLAASDGDEVIAIVRDVTDWKDHEASLERAKRDAAAANVAKSAFLANMSHELRTPLNGVIGFSELLEAEHFGPLTDRQRIYVQNILVSGRHLLTLVNDILDLSKVEAGKLNLSREWTSLEHIADGVMSIVKPLADKRGVVVELSLQPNLPDLLADPVRLKQVLYNLLSNGIKFTPRGGKVIIRARLLEGGRVSVDVEDSGVGIAAEDMPRLFREFEQIDQPDGNKQEGTGLGLALTKRLVEMHGGEVTVRSEVGKGSCFRVILPGLRGTTQERAASVETMGSDGTLVLVVEDDPQAADLIAGHLRTSGISVAFARNAEEAVSLANQLRPAVITLDILMPGKSGWDVLDRLKQSPETAGIPVVVISVVDEKKKGFVLGAAEYLVKPVSNDELTRALVRAGVSTDDLKGLRVCLLDSGNGELNRIEGELKRAGCEVHRQEAFSPVALKEVAPDVAVVDFDTDPQSAIRCFEALDQAGSAAPPVLALLGRDRQLPDEWKAKIDGVGLAEVVQAPDRLVRAVRRMVRESRRSSTGPHGVTWLPQREAIAEHVRDLIHRAEGDPHRVVLVAARVDPASLRVRLDTEVEHHVRRSDLVGHLGDGSLVLAIDNTSGGPIRDLDGRFEAILRQLGIEPHEVRVLHHPVDGRSAQELLAAATKEEKNR